MKNLGVAVAAAGLVIGCNEAVAAPDVSDPLACGVALSISAGLADESSALGRELRARMRWQAEHKARALPIEQRSRQRGLQIQSYLLDHLDESAELTIACMKQQDADPDFPARLPV